MPPPRNKSKVQKQSLHSFSSYDELLVHLRQRLKSFPRKELSDKLGFRSPASMSMFLSGKRALTPKAITGLAGILKLRHDEVLYLQMLAKEKTERPEADQLKRDLLQPTHDLYDLTPDEFSRISRWYNLPLFLFIEALRKIPSIETLHKRLRSKVSMNEIMQSLATWERLGFIVRRGRDIVATKESFLHISSKSANASIQRFHTEMLDRAREAITEQKVEQRVIGCSLFTMDPARIPEAKAMLEIFRENFRRTFLDENATELCQLNYQFFWHTDLSSLSGATDDSV